MRLLFCSFVWIGFVFSQSPVQVTKVSAPKKALVFDATVPASLDAVWTAFTTSDGLSTWLTPNATVELRAGGEWTARFPGGGTGGGTIVSFKPKEELVMSAMAPPQFPHVRAERTTAKWEFTAVDSGSTKVTLTQTGWKSGEEWDRAYEYLANGNAQLLQALQERFRPAPAKK